MYLGLFIFFPPATLEPLLFTLRQRDTLFIMLASWSWMLRTKKESNQLIQTPQVWAMENKKSVRPLFQSNTSSFRILHNLHSNNTQQDTAKIHRMEKKALIWQSERPRIQPLHLSPPLLHACMATSFWDKLCCVLLYFWSLRWSPIYYCSFTCFRPLRRHSDTRSPYWSQIGLCSFTRSIHG